MICKVNETASIWNIIKIARKTFVTVNSSTECLKEERTNPNLLYGSNIRGILDNVEQIMKVKEIYYTYDYLPQENITKDTLQTAVEMYTYISFCPPLKF